MAISITWLTEHYFRCVREDLLPPFYANAFHSLVHKCEDAMHDLKNYSFQRLPDSTFAIMQLTLDMLHLLLVLVLPISLNVDDACFQPITMIGVHTWQRHLHFSRGPPFPPAALTLGAGWCCITQAPPPPRADLDAR